TVGVLLSDVHNFKEDQPPFLPDNAPELLLNLFQLEKEIKEKNMEELKRHQIKVNNLENLKEKNIMMDKNFLDLLNVLRSGENLLVDLLKLGKVKKNAMDVANNGKIDFKNLISYGKKIARYTSAPHNFDPSKPSDGLPVFPPIPQDMHMKRSLLFQPLFGKNVDQAGATTENNEISNKFEIIIDKEEESEEDEDLDLDF
ncbi:hypothetical protein HDU92_000488, partial [Lobulomyces angularis]